MINFTACHERRAKHFDLTTVLLAPVAIDDINEWCWVFESEKKGWKLTKIWKFQISIFDFDEG